MTYYDTQQQYLNNPQFNPQQWAPFNSQTGGYGLGQAAYGQQYGQYGGQPSIGAFGYNPGWGAQPQAQAWGQLQQPQWGGQQQRQLSQQDVSEVVRQLVPVLPQILAQAQPPAGCERSGEADPANRATDCRSAAGPAAITARRHAGRPRLRSARLWPARLWSARLWSARLGPIIRTGQSCAELRSAIWAWRAANAVGVRCPG